MKIDRYNLMSCAYKVSSNLCLHNRGLSIPYISISILYDEIESEEIIGFRPFNLQ